MLNRFHFAGLPDSLQGTVMSWGLELDEVVVLLPRGLMRQMICELLLTLRKLPICLFVVPDEDMHHSINVVFVFSRRVIGLLLSFIIDLIIVFFGGFCCEVNVVAVEWYAVREHELHSVHRLDVQTR